MFAGICSIVIAIVLFCVIMGSYSSLTRAKGRVNKGKSLLISECEKRSGMLKELIAMAEAGMDEGGLNPILENEKKCASVLERMSAQPLPLDPDLIRDFNATQARMTRDISLLLFKLKENSAQAESQKSKDLFTAVKTHQDILELAARRHNKAARYFNQRKDVFPGFLVAKWFHLSHLTFPEVDAEIFTILETDGNQKSSSKES